MIQTDSQQQHLQNQKRISKNHAQAALDICDRLEY